ncbi:MAG: PD40 domain-containing protein [Phycisphaerae bacterium]|jgi:hypothetical protein
MSDKGRVWPDESRRMTDEATGATVWQITSHPSISHGLYFLTDSFLPDERSLVFAGLRTGTANFFRAGFPAGEITQLTDSPGINSFSAVLSADGRTLYFTRDSAIVALDLAGLEERVLADFPGGKLGEVDLSADGAWIVSAIRLGDGHGIAVASARGTGGSIIHRQARTIIHPQFHPTDPTLIEYAADPAPRMHLIRRDGSDNRCLYRHDNDEFVVHETWLGDTGDLVFTVWPKALKRMRLPEGRIEPIAEFNAWHICPSRDGRYVICDTNHPDVGIQVVEVATGARRTLCHPRSSNGGSQWKKSRYALREDFEAAARAGSGDVSKELSWMEMKTDTVYGPQWSHPHPALSRSGRLATFTSDRTGWPQVYVVECGLPAFRSVA